MSTSDFHAAERALFAESTKVEAAYGRGEEPELRLLLELARTYWELAQEITVEAAGE